jgi:hypothetical protein
MYDVARVRGVLALEESMFHRFIAIVCTVLLGLTVAVRPLAARGETPAAFGRRCIPADCVAPPSNIPDILSRRALSAGRLAALGATLDFHHGLLRAALP